MKEQNRINCKGHVSENEKKEMESDGKENEKN